jgi:hypothetical protein
MQFRQLANFIADALFIALLAVPAAYVMIMGAWSLLSLAVRI